MLSATSSSTTTDSTKAIPAKSGMSVNPADEEEARFLHALDADVQNNLEQGKKIRLKGFYLQRGKRFFYSGDMEKSKRELQKALELDPSSRETHAYLSMIETGQHESVVAIESDNEEVIPTLPEYKITMNDILDVSVWGYDELKKEVTVRPDGRISFPLIGDIWALGLTPQQLDDYVTRELSEYVREPKVAVVVKQFSKPQAIVLGEIKRPGMYDVVVENKLVEILARAEGLTDKAKSDSIFLVHQANGKPEISTLSIQEAIKNNTMVNHLDLVYIPSRSTNLAEVLTKVVTPLAAVALTGGTLYDISQRKYPSK
jgi:polysaccharide export outer membrane protein